VAQFADPLENAYHNVAVALLPKKGDDEVRLLSGVHR
jgi:hypothetical protein